MQCMIINLWTTGYFKGKMKSRSDVYEDGMIFTSSSFSQFLNFCSSILFITTFTDGMTTNPF